MLKMKKLTPVLVVERIEPCLGFWEKLGFKKTAEVPHENALGFVILERDGIEVMYQSLASVRADVPKLGKSVSCSSLYLEVSALEPLLGLIEGAEVVLPRRKAPYGSDEIFVREPGGNVVGFAAQP
jgi:hypothetical protein